MTFWKWSKAAGNNGTSDASCPFPEGMAPSQVNDSARGMMAALAKYRDDISGKLLTAGTSTAYTVTSNQGFDSLAHLDGAMIAFVPHVTSGENPTLNVDGTGAKPLRGQSGTALPYAGLKAGTPYVVFYNDANSEFVLHSYFVTGDIPIGGGCDYWGSATPGDDYVFPYGQAISRADHPVCFARLGTTYGSGDGVTTFNLPDKRGRVSAGLDNMGGASADRLNPSMTSGILGATGGAQNQTLSVSQIPSHRHSNWLSDPGHGHGLYAGIDWNYISASAGGIGISNGPRNSSTTASLTGIVLNNAFEGGGQSHLNVQPTIVCNYIIRIK